MATRALVAVAIALLGALSPAHAAVRAQTAAGTGRGVLGRGELAAVNAVLEARTHALVAGDKAAWMAVVDPQSPAAFKDAQARQFDGLRQAPLEHVAFSARITDSGDLAPEGDRFLPETRFTYRFTGYDDRDTVDTLWLTYVLRDGGWYITSDTDVADLGLDTARGLWDTGPVETTTTAHFLVLNHPEQHNRARALAAIGEDAIAKLNASWDKPWLGRIPLILPGSIAELEALLQSTIDLDKFVAFVSYGSTRDDGWTATAPRMYIQDQNLSGYGRAGQVETLTHELSHAAAAPLAGPFIPAWVHEGLADWVATGRSTVERKPAGSDGVLPRDYEFTIGSQAAIIRAYRESRSCVSFLAAQKGVGAPTALFEALGRPKVAAGSVDYRVDEALRATVGVSLADLQAGWAAR